VKRSKGTGAKRMGSLFVIGNGFDLAHEMKTSYEDFHQYLKETYPDASFDGYNTPEVSMMPDGGEAYDNLVEEQSGKLLFGHGNDRDYTEDFMGRHVGSEDHLQDLQKLISTQSIAKSLTARGWRFFHVRPAWASSLR